MNCGHLPSEDPFKVECFLLAHSSHDPLSAIGAKPCLELWGSGCGISTWHVTYAKSSI